MSGCSYQHRTLSILFYWLVQSVSSKRLLRMFAQLKDQLCSVRQQGGGKCYYVLMLSSS
ncbi:UNVERIFIED_CONTAM: hypothetical protein FKN15_012452 [Acipenser sinensis]